MPVSVFTVEQTFCGRRWCELQWISKHIVVIPNIQLVVPGVVVYGGDVLVRVGEWYLNRQLLSTAGVVGINYHVTADPPISLPLIVLEDGAHSIQHTTSHEGVARPPFVKTSGPCPLKAKCVWVHL